MLGWKVSSNLLVIENTVWKYSTMVLVLISHVVGFRLPLRIMGSFAVRLSLVNFLELSGRLGSSAGEFWGYFLIYQRKINHTIYLIKWFAGGLPEVNGSIQAYLNFFSDYFLQIAFILIVS